MRHYRDYLPEFLPLPHPSPRNQMWLKRNLWFAEEVLPLLRELVQEHLLGCARQLSPAGSFFTS